MQETPREVDHRHSQKESVIARLRNKYSQGESGDCYEEKGRKLREDGDDMYNFKSR